MLKFQGKLLENGNPAIMFMLTTVRGLSLSSLAAIIEQIRVLFAPRKCRFIRFIIARRFALLSESPHECQCKCLSPVNLSFGSFVEFSRGIFVAPMQGLAL